MKSPHIIVEMECWDKVSLSAVAPKINFIMVHTFTDDETVPVAINKFEASKIYHLNLQDLAD